MTPKVIRTRDSESDRAAFIMARDGRRETVRWYVRAVCIYDAAAINAWNVGNREYGRRWAQAAQACRLVLDMILSRRSRA